MFNIINSLTVKSQTAVLARQEGQAMVEYGLLAALVSIAAIVALGFVGGDLLGIFTAIETALDGVAGG